MSSSSSSQTSGSQTWCAWALHRSLSACRFLGACSQILSSHSWVWRACIFKQKARWLRWSGVRTPLTIQMLLPNRNLLPLVRSLTLGSSFASLKVSSSINSINWTDYPCGFLSPNKAVTDPRCIRNVVSTKNLVFMPKPFFASHWVSVCCVCLGGREGHLLKSASVSSILGASE